MASGRRRGLKVLLVIIALILLAAAGSFFFYQQALRPVSSVEETVSFRVEEGESLSDVTQSLQQDGLIRSSDIARLYSRLHGISDQYAGTFVISPSMSTPEILEYLSDPDNVETGYIIVTEPEGTWAKDLAEDLAYQFPQYHAQDFIDLWNDPAYLKGIAQEYSWFKPDQISDEVRIKLEGYLFPETYYMDADDSPQEITAMFLDQFDAVYQQLKSQILKSEYSLEEILTMASIIQFESGSVQDMKDIAGVFYNRLAQGMPLGSSVTVCYALYDDFNDHQDCEVNTNIDSPYNTYLHDGLPIGPILNPSKEAIEAALDPADNDYLYFVADIYGDGSVHYARTYEEHLENVERYNLVIE